MEPGMNLNAHLLEYISYFESESDKNGKGLVTLNSLTYLGNAAKGESFMRCINGSDLMIVNCLDCIDIVNFTQLMREIELVSFRHLQAIFIFINRQERFQEGLWAKTTLNGIILMLLKQIKVIVEGGDKCQKYN